MVFCTSQKPVQFHFDLGISISDYSVGRELYVDDVIQIVIQAFCFPRTDRDLIAIHISLLIVNIQRLVLSKYCEERQ